MGKVLQVWAASLSSDVGGWGVVGGVQPADIQLSELLLSHTFVKINSSGLGVLGKRAHTSSLPPARV